MRMIFALLTTLLLALGSANAQPAPPLPVDEAFALSVDRSDGRLVLRWEIASGYYLYRDHFHVTRDGEAIRFSMSNGEIKEDPGFGTVEVLFDEAELVIDNLQGDTLRVIYQGCQDGGICYRPEARTVDLASLSLSDGGNGFASRAAGKATSTSLAAAGIEIAVDEGSASSLLEGSSVFAIMASFLGFGLLLAFTPCVFPIYPILLGMLGRQGEAMSRKRGLMLSSSYVVALALAFALVGAVVGWSGQNIQFALQSPLTTMAMAAFFLLLASSMFGLFELQLPSALTSRFASRPKAGGSIGSAAALGFTSALIVGPCVTAPLAGALVYIAQGGDWRLGALALFALGLGKGLPLMVMATFGAGLLPRAGKWMEAVKRLFGFSFIGMAIWIAAPLMPLGLDLWLYAPLLLLAAIDMLLHAPSRWAKTGLAGLVFVGSILALGAFENGKSLQAMARIVIRSTPEPQSAVPHAKAATRDELLEAFEAAGAAGSPLIVYVTADWCVICRTIDRSVLPDDGVVAALDGVHLVKFDVSDFSGDTQSVLDELRAAGPPTMMFFDTTRREAPNTRLVGAMSPADLIRSAGAIR